LTERVLTRLSTQVPSGETYDRERKVYELLPAALECARHGMDILIDYRPAAKHLLASEVTIIELLRQESGLVFVPSHEPFSSTMGTWTVYRLSTGEEAEIGTPLESASLKSVM
jgi:hypothetical protein